MILKVYCITAQDFSNLGSPANTDRCTHTQTHTHKFGEPCKHTDTRTHAHTHAHTHTHTHTHTQSLPHLSHSLSLPPPQNNNKHIRQPVKTSAAKSKIKSSTISKAYERVIVAQSRQNFEEKFWTVTENCSVGCEQESCSKYMEPEQRTTGNQSA